MENSGSRPLSIDKPQTGALVVGSVTTSEYVLLYVFFLVFFNMSAPLESRWRPSHNFIPRFVYHKCIVCGISYLLLVLLHSFFRYAINNDFLSCWRFIGTRILQITGQSTTYLVCVLLTSSGSCNKTQLWCKAFECNVFLRTWTFCVLSISLILQTISPNSQRSLNQCRDWKDGEANWKWLVRLSK